MSMDRSALGAVAKRETNELQADASFLENVPLVELHKSNILKLEMEELLHECRMNSDTPKDYISIVSNLISKIATSKKDGVVVGCPFVLQSDKVATTTMEMPSKLTLVPTGSYALPNCGTKKAGNANVLPTFDCAIVVPNDYWNAKDYLNHRYMDKRNLILWKVANFLSDKKYKKHVGTVEWRHYNGNQSTPSLILTPPVEEDRKKKKSKKSMTSPKFRIQLVMAMESLDWIPAPRLFPNRCNIKQGTTPTKSTPTSPYYNSILARDAFFVDMKDILSEDINDLPHFADSFILLKVWCLQRGFLRGHDSLDEMQLGVLLLYLYRTKRASPRMAPLQVVTVWMKFVAEEFQSNKVYVMPEQDRNEAQTVTNCEAAKLYVKQTKESPLDSVRGDPATLIKCHERYSCTGAVLLDATMLGNYLGSLSPSYCESLRHQARTTVTCLNSTRSFASLFMTNARFWNCMDAYLHIPLKDIAWRKHAKAKNSLWAGGKQGRQELYDLGEVECLSRGLVSVLRRALGDRVTDVRILTTGNGSAAGGDADEIPTHPMSSSAAAAATSFRTSMEMETLVVGIKIDINNCHRAVDRGPPADNTHGVQAFLDLWGDAAELRRFKDGAIVHAVVWNTPDLTNDAMEEGVDPYVVFEGDERTQGGMVERITQHIIGLHFCREGKTKPQFLLRDMLAMVDGVRTLATAGSSATSIPKLIANSTLAHRNIMSAFDSLTTFLRKNSEQPLSGTGRSALGLPLQIDGVEALSPSLRYSSSFPAIPHPLLGGEGSLGGKVAGVVSSGPIHIQLRFGRSSKWPTDIKAMGAAKTAMLVQIADGIETMKMKGGCRGFDGPIIVTPTHLTLGYNGYSWRIVVRADPELHLLRGLHKPSDDAVRMLRALTKDHITASSHHATIHGVHTSHPSAGHVVRLLNNWLATHMLSGLVPFEAVELLVAKVYTDNESPLDAPSTVVSGFMRVLQLIATYDWVRKPLVVDPQGHLTDDDMSKIDAKFHTDRGPDFSKGPIMYIVAPYDCMDLLKEDEETETQKSIASFASWRPTYTLLKPERVTVFRAAELAKRSYSYLLDCLTGKADAKKWTATFKETQASLKSYGILLRVDKDFLVDTTFSSTGDEVVFKSADDDQLESMYSRSAKSRHDGPKALRRKVYKNLSSAQNQFLLYDWNPVQDTTDMLRQKFGNQALFFYNELAPEVIALVWRPSSFRPKAFSAVSSESVRPVQDDDWKSDSMAIDNVKDFMRELSQTTKDIVVDVKVLDDRSHKRQTRELTTPTNTKKRALSNDISESESDDDAASMNEEKT